MESVRPEADHQGNRAWVHCSHVTNSRRGLSEIWMGSNSELCSLTLLQFIRAASSGLDLSAAVNCDCTDALCRHEVQRAPTVSHHSASIKGQKKESAGLPSLVMPLWSDILMVLKRNWIYRVGKLSWPYFLLTVSNQFSFSNFYFYFKWNAKSWSSSPQLFYWS